MKILQDAGIDNVLFWINPVEKKSTRSFPRCYVNRGKVTSRRLLVTPLAAPSIIKQVSITTKGELRVPLERCVIQRLLYREKASGRIPRIDNLVTIMFLC
jgi:hypothetical protein